MHKRVEDLKAGDEFVHYHLDLPYNVTVVRDAEDHTDMFGRPDVKVWCRSGDAEGWMTFGHGAEIMVAEDL